MGLAHVLAFVVERFGRQYTLAQWTILFPVLTLVGVVVVGVRLGALPMTAFVVWVFATTMAASCLVGSLRTAPLLHAREVRHLVSLDFWRPVPGPLGLFAYVSIVSTACFAMLYAEVLGLL